MASHVQAERQRIASLMAAEVRRFHDAAAQSAVQPGYCSDHELLQTGLYDALMRPDLRDGGGAFVAADRLSCRTLLQVVRYLVCEQDQAEHILASLYAHVHTGLGQAPGWVHEETRLSFDINILRGYGYHSTGLADVPRAHPAVHAGVGSVVVIALWAYTWTSRPVYWHEMLITATSGPSLWTATGSAHEGALGRLLKR